MKLTLTDDEISEIVAAAYPTPHADMGTLRARLTRAFGERVNPYESWNGYTGRSGLILALFDAAAKVADGCDAGGGLLATTFNHVANRAALKRIVEEIRGMA